jgi:hypothetical protein
MQSIVPGEGKFCIFFLLPNSISLTQPKHRLHACFNLAVFPVHGELEPTSVEFHRSENYAYIPSEA